MEAQITTVGLKEFRKELAQTDKQIAKELGKEYQQIGTRIVDGATARADALGGVAARAARALSPSAAVAALSLRLRASQYPEVLGAEFGGGARPRTRQFRPHLGREGYFLYPTIREQLPQIVEDMADAIERAAKAAFPD